MSDACDQLPLRPFSHFTQGLRFSVLQPLAKTFRQEKTEEAVWEISEILPQLPGQLKSPSAPSAAGAAVPCAKVVLAYMK
ncbi:hypothetical protein ABB07_38165 [Streptomyces incarnatus]|uniref:Uncharacterized protein n=1 Tax=Streptomyces incarnatus TaxID=665007 RepID=A0ABN4GPF5_9ACTN|nr:hypothetical protein ABB07_38165 [Streptomyces incarnatus]